MSPARLSAWQLRRLGDAGVIPTAARIGGKRRFRLQDVIVALAAARPAGIEPLGTEPTGRDPRNLDDRRGDDR